MIRPTAKRATLATAAAVVVLIGTRAGSHAEQNPAEAKIDSKATGLPTTHRDRGAYIMWNGSPYAHLQIMGSPEGNR